MKKILFSIAFMLTMGLAASAQFDGFFKWEDVDNRVLDEYVFMLPSSHGSLTNTEAPLDGGLLILGVFGAGYAVMRKKK